MITICLVLLVFFLIAFLILALGTIIAAAPLVLVIAGLIGIDVLVIWLIIRKRRKKG